MRFSEERTTGREKKEKEKMKKKIIPAAGNFITT
jgi:hypothetical protein